MNIPNRIDLQNIYSKQIQPAEVFEDLLKLLDSLGEQYLGRALLRTRNTENKILTSSGIQYWTFDEESSSTRPGEVILAGALEKPERGNKAPVVRVRAKNPHLTSIPASAIFPFERERKTSWTCVIIRPDTIGILGALLKKEVDSFVTSNRRV